MFSIFSWLGTLIGGPIVKGALDAYRLKLAAGQSREKIIGDIALRELDLQIRETELQTTLRIHQLGRWYEPEKLMGYCVALYFAKLLIWDKIFNLGITEPLAGWTADTANLIVMFYFGKRGIENVAKIITQARK